jgi:hypothetical protein
VEHFNDVKTLRSNRTQRYVVMVDKYETPSDFFVFPLSLDISCGLYEIGPHVARLDVGFMSMMRKSRSSKAHVLAYIHVGKAQ